MAVEYGGEPPGTTHRLSGCRQRTIIPRPGAELNVVLEPSDIVRIRHLAVAEREVDGASAEPPQPRAGETAVVVDSLGDGLYLVERMTDDGEPIWVAEFHESELELVERPASGD
jgi:hypothetical protein